ncbi:glycoside hydrolase family 15 protein [Halobaculum gomorrense]|uniref:Glucoamylase (Glucan-1,4-alpha-glucosidase), GH15 family n=1 Tax=Halobaculum gomorrense TaxID=43928 RepID=A0A1M5PKB5_9EURY|nr:glycoside hydrolase family 15 protein [Halobaculum gomorrense]SHH01959.1 Glucoamylase (glucan-1,4-alpha-glucosidase), GH15 family [Halobaculum gomorrense]
MTEPAPEFPVPSDKDAITSTPAGQSQHVLVTANRYADNPRYEYDGAIIEETSAFRSDVELFYDLHTLVWDADLGETHDGRNDAVASDLDWASAAVPELQLTNEFRFGDDTEGTVRQEVIASSNQCSVLVRNTASFDAPHERTLFTVFNLGIRGHSHEDSNAVQSAHVVDGDEYQALTATDGTRYLAFVQSHDDRRRFDGHRIGTVGRSSGSERSAWADIYEENDGWIDSTTSGAGNLDAGFGLHVSDVESAAWLTAVGFATDSEERAIEHALDALDAGYEDERTAFAEAWDDWNSTVTTAPTGEEFVDDLYERSLTSLKCAEDHCQAMIAGAFKPADMTYKFIWPRDQVIIVQALAAAGATNEARQALDWLHRVQITDEDEATHDDRGIDRRGSWWQNYYTTGEPHWRALQLDQVGGPIYAHWLLWRETGDDSLRDAHYEMSKRAAEFLLDWDNGYGFPKRHQDPWEEVWGYSTEGSAAAIAGLRCMAELADSVGEREFAVECREQADVWADNVRQYCFREGTEYGDHYVTAGEPEHGTPAPDGRPDAAAFMAYWPWNVLDADDDGLVSTVELADDPVWSASDTPCVGRYPGDVYTPSGTAEDGGWPLCEAYADVVRWRSGVDPTAVEEYVTEHVGEWTTSAGLLPERVDGDGTVSWNSNLQWSQAMYVLLVESHVRGEPYGMAPTE